jgi:hypothetical protein
MPTIRKDMFYDTKPNKPLGFIPRIESDRDSNAAWNILSGVVSKM